MTTLDFGCGRKKAPGAIGTDLRPLPGVDLVCDLAHFPYPFATDSADCILLNHVLEHLDDPVAVLTELWRIIRSGGKLHIRVPHFTGRYSWSDPTHRRAFSSGSFAYFGGNHYDYYTQARFRVGALRLVYFLEPPPRRIYRAWGVLVQSLLNRHPTFFERYLAYLVGGIDEIQVTLEAVKNGTGSQLSRQ